MTQEAKPFSNFETIDKFIANYQHSYFSTPGFIAYYNQRRAAFEAEENIFNEAVNAEDKATALHQTFMMDGIAGPVILAIHNVNLISSIWPDTPIDYFRSYWPFLEFAIDLEALSDERVANWFRENMTYRTFFNMIYRHALRYGKALFKEDEPPQPVKDAIFDDVRIATEETSADVLDKMALAEEYVYENHDNRDPEVTQKLNRAYTLLYWIAGNPNASPETLTRLGMGQIGYVKAQAALNPSTPEEIRTYLILERGVDDVNNQLKDTFDQLQKMLKAGDTIVPQTEQEDGTIKKWRWRLVDFHDNISYLFLMRDIVNVEFTQNTIKNPYTEGSWTIYQPKDSVALAMWAQKVRNCVRSRESNVISGQTEIVFIERDGAPAYTVEVKPGLAKRSSVENLTIHEIQAFGARTGATRDTDNEILNMIKRAMRANV
jgi:hypothetical protein